MLPFLLRPTVELQDVCGIPLGVVAQPLAVPDGRASPPALTCWAADLARCARCHAYINSLCEIDAAGWACSLCGCANDFASATSLRRWVGVRSCVLGAACREHAATRTAGWEFAGGAVQGPASPAPARPIRQPDHSQPSAHLSPCPSPRLLCVRSYYGADEHRRASLPELGSPVVDVLCPLAAGDPQEGVEEVVALEAQPAVLALVDACCSEEGLELVKGSLAAAVEALPPAARFGLVSFGSQAGASGRVVGGCRRRQ